MMDKYLSDLVTSLDWNCIDTDTQYLTHSIHRYSGKFIPQIAQQAIELLTKPGDIVLDPFCGSGTTLLECALGGRYAIGLDLNPLAVLISRVKTTPVNKKVINQFVYALEEQVSPLLKGQNSLGLFGQSQVSLAILMEKVYQDARWTDRWYKKWFKDDVLFELIAIHQQIAVAPNQLCRNIGFVAFSDILRKSSNANGSYPNVMFDKNRGMPPPATPRFLERLKQVAQLVSDLEMDLNNKPMPTVLCADTRDIPLVADSVDAIITHPPYIGSIPYAEYGVLSLVWLGYNPKSLDERLIGGKRQSSDVVERFNSGFRAMIQESWRVLKTGRALFMLLGHPTVKGQRIDLVEMAKKSALTTGFELVAFHHRNGINRRANLMGDETLLIFQK